MSDDANWAVVRWSGRRNNRHRVVFSGMYSEARRRFDKEAQALRQGEVLLYDATGTQADRAWAPTLRTRW